MLSVIDNANLSALELILTDFQRDAELHSAMASAYNTSSYYLKIRNSLSCSYGDSNTRLYRSDRLKWLNVLFRLHWGTGFLRFMKNNFLLRIWE